MKKKFRKLAVLTCVFIAVAGLSIMLTRQVSVGRQKNSYRPPAPTQEKQDQLWKEIIAKTESKKHKMLKPAGAVSEELWTDAARKEMGSTSGELQVMDDGGKIVGKCPLKHTDVKVDITGFIARVTVTQQFQNPYTDKIEAVYVFPLSQNSAVDDMTMLVGDRKIKGDIKRREEARKIYEEAKNSGHVAALLEQERTNIFTQSVANIMPGEQVTVTISYIEYLKYQDGQYEFVFPMVVGPRYIPGAPTGQQGTGWAPDTDNVPDASNITPPVTPEGTRAGHDISLMVHIDAGLPIQDVESRLHEVTLTELDKNEAVVELKNSETIPNKDFILFYKTAGKKIEDAVVTYNPEGKGGYFSLILQPPERPKASEITPKEMIFVIDTSGSQMGWPIEKAKETMKYAIKNMNPDDTFQLLSFSNNVSKLFDSPKPNTEANREKAMRYLGEKMGGGGTEMMKAILAALTPRPDAKRLRIVCFMTDGFVGNDMEIADAVRRNLGNARFFSFGVSDSPNRFLLDELAAMGRGEVEYVTLEDSGEKAARKFYERIANPLLTDIKIDWGGLPVSDVEPEVIPDMYSSKTVVVKGRFDGAGAKGTIRVTGKTAAGKFVREIEVQLPNKKVENSVLAPLWARARIETLMRRDYRGMQYGKPDGDIKEQITRLGLDYRIMTQYTSFVAVEEKIVTEGGVPRTVAVPVEMPEGVSYQGVFGETAPGQATAGRAGYGGSMPSGTVMSKRAAPMVAADAATTEFKEADKAESDSDGSHNLTTGAPEQEQRLSAELRGLADKVAKQGKNGSLKTAGVKVVNWKVEIKITLSDWSDKNFEELKKLGFVISNKSESQKTVTGKIDVRKLEAIAQLEFVSLIEPREK